MLNIIRLFIYPSCIYIVVSATVRFIQTGEINSLVLYFLAINAVIDLLYQWICSIIELLS